MESLNRADIAPESVIEKKALATGAGAAPIEPLAEPLPVVPVEALNRTIGVFEKLCTMGGATKLKTRLRIKVPHLHTLAGRLVL